MNSCAYLGCEAVGIPCWETWLCVRHGIEATQMLDAKFDSNRTWEQACAAVRIWLRPEMKLVEGA